MELISITSIIFYLSTLKSIQAVVFYLQFYIALWFILIFFLKNIKHLYDNQMKCELSKNSH